MTIEKPGHVCEVAGKTHDAPANRRAARGPPQLPPHADDPVRVDARVKDGADVARGGEDVDAYGAGGLPAGHGRVLVVEDDPILVIILAKALSEAHAVVATTSAKEALARLLAGEQYDLILCDLMMPEMTGIELYAELERAAPELTAQVVFFTGGAFTPDAHAFLKRVPNRRVQKPISPSQLLAIVDEVIAAWRARR